MLKNVASIQIQKVAIYDLYCKIFNNQCGSSKSLLCHHRRNDWIYRSSRKRNLYTEQLEPVTPPNVHNTTVLLAISQSPSNHGTKKMSPGYGPRRGSKSTGHGPVRRSEVHRIWSQERIEVHRIWSYKE